MKARYHKFTGTVPVVFVQDVRQFMKGLGLACPYDNNSTVVPIMHEINIGPLQMLVFSEGMIRTLYGSMKESIIEAHLALWAGQQRTPGDDYKSYKYALGLAERYERKDTHELLRRNFTTQFGESVEPITVAEPGSTTQSIESILFDN